MNKRNKELSIVKVARLNNEKGKVFSSSTIQKKARRNTFSFLFGTFLTLLLVISLNTSAQVSALLNPSGYGYIFSTTSGFYKALNGGTVFQSGVTLSTDGFSGAISLPSTFTFNGMRRFFLFLLFIL